MFLKIECLSVKPWLVVKEGAEAGIKGPKGSWKKECMVVPAAFMAATPVGANTTVFFLVLFFICFKKVVFPVPALPVRNRDLFVDVTKSIAKSYSIFISP